MRSLGRIGTILIIVGIASIAFGILTLIRPGTSIAAIVLLFGIYALADGAFLLSFGFRQQEDRAPYVIRGLISIAAGVITFAYPGMTALSLYVLVGAWAVAAGIAELAMAVSIRKTETHVSGLVIAGVLSLVCGVLLLTLPLAGLVALLGLVAAYAIVNGVALIGTGVRFHNLMRPTSTQ
jgi:uncharacterized membrane protein HdeD (DUF308 family)